MALKFEITGDNSNLLSSLDGARAGVRRTARDIEESGLRIEDMFKRIGAAVGVAFTLDQAKNFVRSAMEIRGQFQQLEIAFNTMLQSEEKATMLMSQLVETAAKTPFDLQGVAQGAKQLLAYGIAADEVNETITRLGDIAAGLSIPLDDLVYLYGTTMTQGRMFTMDLRQFMGRGIPMAEELAKQFGVTKNEVAELVTAGQVGADAVKQAIWNMTNEGSRFGGLMAEQSKSITGQISNIGDAVDNMFNEIGKKSEGVINDALSGVSYLVENYEKVGKVIISVAGVYGTYKAAVLAVIAAEKIAAAARLAHIHQQALLQLATDILTKKMALLNATMLTNPWVLATTAIAGIIAVMVNLETHADLVKKAEEDLNNEREKAIKLEEEHKAKINELIQIAGDESLSTDNRRGALIKLEQQYPAIFSKYDTEADKLAHILEIKNAIAEADGKKSITDLNNEYDKNQAEIEKLLKKVDVTYSTQSSSFGVFTNQAGGRTSQDEARLTALQNRQKELKKQIDRDNANEYMKHLTGVSNADLQAQINVRKDLLARMKLEEKKYGATINGGVKGTFTADELQGQLQVMQSELNRRNEATYTPAQRKAQLSSELASAKKALADFDKTSSKFTISEAEEQRKKLQDAVSAAEKKYKSMGGETSKSSENKRDADEQRRQANEKAIAQEIAQLNASTELAAIESKEDGVKKRLELADYEHTQELEKLDKKHADLVEKRGGNLTSEEEAAFTKAREQADKDYHDKAQQILTEEWKAQYDAMNDYLEKYGTFEEQRLAITAKFEEQIAKARTDGEKQSLQREMQSALSKVDTAMIKQKIDWAGIFGNMGGMLFDEMKSNLESLKAYMKTDEFKSLDAQNQQTISQLDSEIQAKIGAEVDFSHLSDQTKALENAMISLNAAETAEKDAAQKTSAAIKAYNDAVERGEKDLGPYQIAIDEARNAQTEASEAVRTFASSAQDAAVELHDNVKNITSSINGVVDGLNKLKSGSLASAYEGLAQTCNNLSTLIGGKVGNSLSTFAGKLGGIIGELVQAALGILDILKDGISGILTSLIDTVFNAINGLLHDILSGEFVTKTLQSVTNGLTTLFDTLSFGSLGNWLGGNEDAMEEEIAKLGTANESLAKSIETLSENIKQSDSTNQQSIDAYKKALEAEKEWESNQRKRIDDKASEWTNSGYGFLGLRGKKSFNYYLNDRGRDWWGWQSFNDTLKQHGYNQTVNSAQELWNLSPEMMQLLRDYAPSAWSEMLNSGGHGDPSELIDEYINRAGKIEELTSAINEKLTGYTWEGFLDSYKSILKDLTSTTEDFADSIGNMISNALLESLVNDEFAGRIKQLYKYIAEHSVDGLDASEIEYINNENESIANDMINRRQNLIDAGLIKEGDADAYKQEASSKGFNAMSQDTGDELSGRFTALQIAGESIAANVISIFSQMQLITQTQTSSNTYLQEIRNMMITGNSYLEDIAKYSKKIYIDFATKLDDITTNTK